VGDRHANPVHLRLSSHLPGVWRRLWGALPVPSPDETRDAVRSALGAGYRLIDTAAAYGNERQVGEAVHGSGLDRSEIFLETKIWISDYGYDETLHGFEKSARKLGVDQIDLLILHQALPSAFDRTLEAYRALETLLAAGWVRAIGVSNFMVDHLTALLDRASVGPAVNGRRFKSDRPDHGTACEAGVTLGRSRGLVAAARGCDTVEDGIAHPCDHAGCR
jgi:diketogulonate reductase-like aldo/keto reductase